MDKGIIQQVDSPQLLYDHPRNQFVAGFIGSPAMNFIPGNLVKDVRTGDRVTFEFKLANDGQAELTAIKRSSAAAQSDKK